MTSHLRKNRDAILISTPTTFCEMARRAAVLWQVFWKCFGFSYVHCFSKLFPLGVWYIWWSVQTVFKSVNGPKSPPLVLLIMVVWGLLPLNHGAGSFRCESKCTQNNMIGWTCQVPSCLPGSIFMLTEKRVLGLQPWNYLTYVVYVLPLIFPLMKKHFSCWSARLNLFSHKNDPWFEVFLHNEMHEIRDLRSPCDWFDSITWSWRHSKHCDDTLS